MAARLGPRFLASSGFTCASLRLACGVRASPGSAWLLPCVATLSTGPGLRCEANKIVPPLHKTPRDIPPPATDNSWYVKLIGLPYEATKDEIAKFLEPCNVKYIAIRLNFNGRPSGEAFVELASSKDMDLAIDKNREFMGKRYIQIVPSAADTVERVVGQPKTSVRLQGLPYQVTREELSNWLSQAAVPLDVDIKTTKNGRPNGIAFATFSTPEEAGKVVTEMHKKYLGKRYVECY